MLSNGRRILVATAVTVAGLSFGAGPPPAGAAPMSGVVLTSPVRVFDGALHRGTTPIATAVPVTAQQVLVRLTASGSSVAGAAGVVFGHRCGVAVDPATDGVLPAVAFAASNDVYVPVAAATFCLTSSIDLARLVVDVHGYVDPSTSGGSVYVDLPWFTLAPVTGPVGSAPLNTAAAGVPPGATGVAAIVSVSDTATSGFADLFACDQGPSTSAVVSWAADEGAAAVVAGTPISAAGLCLRVVGTATVEVAIDGYYAAGVAPSGVSPPQWRYSEERAPGFAGQPPRRLFDTRIAGAKIIGGQSYRLDLSSVVPAETTAVAMNVTATEPTGPGYVTVYPCNNGVPETSSVNFTSANQTVPNFVTVAVDDQRAVCFYASTATHLLADLAGWYVFGGGDGFTPLTPLRLFDTRTSARLEAGSVYDFDASAIVPPGTTSIVVNLTATEPAAAGFVTAYPCDQARPTASNLNVFTGQTVPNLATVKLSGNGHVCFYTLNASHLLADLAGVYGPGGGAGFIAQTPYRFVDTRQLGAPLSAGSVSAANVGPDAVAVAFNLTVTEPTAAGFATAFPCASGVPLASNVNYRAAQTVANMVITAADANKQVCVYTLADTHLIIDPSGYFTTTPTIFGFPLDGTDID